MTDSNGNLVVNPAFEGAEPGDETAPGWHIRPGDRTFQYRIEALGDERSGRMGPGTSSSNEVQSRPGADAEAPKARQWVQRIIGHGRGDGYVWQRFPVSERTRYTVSGRVRTEGEMTAQLRLFFYDESGRILLRTMSRYVLGDTDWTTIHMDCEAPAGACEGLLFAIAFTSAGTASCLWERVDVIPASATPGGSNRPEATSTQPAARPVRTDISFPASCEAREQEPLILPKPKSVRLRGGRPFRLAHDGRIVVVWDAGKAPHGTAVHNAWPGWSKAGGLNTRPHDHRAVERVAVFLQNALTQRYQVRLPVEIRTAGTDLTNSSDIAAIHLVAGSEGPGAGGRHPEGYTLDIAADGVRIYAMDARGLFYGVQTLLQLVDSRDAHLGGHRPLPCPVPDCVVDDWPDLPFRGVHLLVDEGSAAMIQDLVDHVFARFKLNTMVLECSLAKWESHPELWRRGAAGKAQLESLARFARDRFLDVIPLIQSLGHCEYLFHDGAHLDICEDPEHPYAYNPLNPRSYELVFDLMSEAVELFQPRFLHIGHDEVQMEGRFPNSAEGQRLGFAELFVMDTNRIAAFLRGRGVRPMMWADEVLEAGFIPHMGRLDKDIVMVDWQYTPFRHYRGIDMLRSAGFDAIGASWFELENIHTFARDMRRSGGCGMLQTTWAGSLGIAEAASRELHQYAAHVCAAEAFWNADGYSSLSDLPYDPARIVHEIIARHSPRASQS